MKMTNEELCALVDKATAGDDKALEKVINEIQDFVFNLSLRMLGSFQDAEDAAQEILLKVVTRLASFKKESAFTTWVFRIAANHLKDYKKGMFAQRPLSFEYYGYDIENGKTEDIPDLSQNIEKDLLAEELKMSCTNVMLQCLDPQSRCVFILGTMFHLDSRIAGEILNITPEAYRQQLSRSRKKMGGFLEQYCGEYGSGKCRCKNRIHYAVQSHRLNPQNLEYTSATETPGPVLVDVKNAMEEIDGLSAKFMFCKTYQTNDKVRNFMKEFLKSAQLTTVQGGKEINK